MDHLQAMRVFARVAQLGSFTKGAEQLVEVLPEWKAAPLPVSIVFPHGRHLAPRVRIFIDWVAQLIKEAHAGM